MQATPIVDGRKVCTRCVIEKALDEFPRRWAGRHRDHRHWCRDCSRAYLKTYWAKRGDRSAYNRRQFYGLSESDYQALKAAQGGVCAICLTAPEDVKTRWKVLVVDHDHRTGQVRGLLCAHCNQAIGLFRENPAVLMNAIHYLSRDVKEVS